MRFYLAPASKLADPIDLTPRLMINSGMTTIRIAHHDRECPV
jgi:hypothetical protein